MIRRREPIKKSVKVLICVAILVLFIAGNIYFRGYTVYTFSPQSCEHLFGLTPQGMLTEINDAEPMFALDDDGNFVMRLSNFEKLFGRIFCKLSILDARIYGIRISRNYSLIEYECDVLTDERSDKSSYTLTACMLLRIMNEEEYIDVEMRLVEHSTGTVVTRDQSDYGCTYEKHNIFSKLNNTALT